MNQSQTANNVQEMLEIIDIDGKKYRRVTTPEGEYWDAKTLAKHIGVSWDAIYYHLRTKKDAFGRFIRIFEVTSSDGKRRRHIFLLVPGAINELSIYSRRMRDDPQVQAELRKIMTHVTEVQKGNHLIIHKEDLERFKEHTLADVLKNLDQTLRTISDTQVSLYEEVQQLKSERTFTAQHTRIIQKIIGRYVEKYDIPYESVWRQFSRAFNISGYRNAERKFFRPFLQYWYQLDRVIVCQVFNEVNNNPKIEEQIKKDMLAVLSGDDTVEERRLLEYR